MSATIAFILLAVLPVGQPADAPARDAQAESACLHDVSFADARHGWAVGDRGVILHTEDGGQHWTPQQSGVVCTLRAVSFIDARTGWAAGGMAWPFLHDSSGVVLCTYDGGRTWRREPVLLPAVRKMRFVSDRQGWAIADSSAMYPGGTFFTRDGGRSWQPACEGGARGLTTGDFYDGHHALLGGSLGQWATIAAGEFSRKSHEGAILQNVHATQSVPPRYGWLAGDGGWIALTIDGGNSWRPPLGKLPEGAALFDFHALAVRGGTCWIAGTPGSRIFSTADAGRTWSAAVTGVTVPLCALTFVDEQQGWAVGQLGTIVATSDGGRTWRQQRAAAPRAAFMAIAARPGDLPLELIARVCKDQGYQGVGEVIGRDDTEIGRASDAPATDRLHQALVDVGAAGGEQAWGFPLRAAELQIPAPQVIESWNQYHGGRAVDALVGHLVRQIRTWRPDVLGISEGEGGDGAAEVVRQAAATAVRLAGDPAYLSDAFRAAGCEPWTVQRVFLTDHAAAGGTIAIRTDDWSPRLGQTWADAALRSRGLLERGPAAAPAAIGVQNMNGAETRKAVSLNPAAALDIMADLRSSTGGVSRPTRDDAGSNRDGLDGLTLRRQVEATFAHLDKDPAAFVDRLPKGTELPQGIEPAEAAAITFRIAQRLWTSGRWDLADKVLGLFLDRHADDPLARWVVVERLQHSVSGTLRVPLADGTRSVPDTFALARQIESVQPDLFASPVIRYPLASAYRRQNQTAQAERLYVLDHRGVDRDAWWNCARGERWLAERRGPPPRPMIACPAASERPHLDGRLDEALWKKCPAIALASTLGDDRDPHAGAPPATVRFAHDEQFLYVAIECRQAPGARYEATSERRTRDADLSRRDRVDIFLDLDRTYASYYQLTIDDRGWAADAFMGDKSWNPKWFVAAATADGTWTAEAAIPLAELGGAIVPGKTVWALGIQRTVPGVGFQAWSSPAAPQVMPEGFGWLEFE